MKILNLEIENVKRVKAISFSPSPSGLTVIGGRNAQGKTSVLDAIAFAFGGGRKQPTNYQRDDVVRDPHIKIVTDDGLIVERKGATGALHVTDSTGAKAGQALLDATVGKISINLPAFLQAPDREKADILLGVLGLKEKIEELDKKEKAAYDTRTATGRIAEQKKKAAEEAPYYADLPNELISVSELISRQQAILLQNAENAKARMNIQENKQKLQIVQERIATMQANLNELLNAKATLEAQLEAGRKEADIVDLSTEEIEHDIENIESTNVRIRENQRRSEMLAEYNVAKEHYDALTEEIAAIRKERCDLLEGAALPYPGLTVVDGKLCLNGKAWDCMSGSQQLIVSTAIAAKLAPKCNFVLLDKLEQLDEETLEEFDRYLQSKGLQAIGTRVSTGAECTIIIEDGRVVGDVAPAPEPEKPIINNNEITLPEEY